MAKEYIDPQKRYEDNHSTGVLFLVLGALGTASVVLCWMDIFRVPLNNFQLIILLAMFIAFIGFGIWSLKHAAGLAKTISSEHNEVAMMRQWIKENRETFCVTDTAELSESEIYFQREQDIHDAILNQFPEIDESLLDIFVEETYQALFEKI